MESVKSLDLTQLLPKDKKSKSKGSRTSQLTKVLNTMIGDVRNGLKVMHCGKDSSNRHHFSLCVTPERLKEDYKDRLEYLSRLAGSDTEEICETFFAGHLNEMRTVADYLKTMEADDRCGYDPEILRGVTLDDLN